MSRFIIPFAALLIAVGLFFGYVRPTWTLDIAAKKVEIASYDSALDAAARFAEKQAELEQKRNAIPQESLQRLDAFLPDSVDNIQLILDLNALAARSGIELSDFDTGAINNAEDQQNTEEDPDARNQPLVDSLQLSLKAEGTYAAFRSFIAGIEQSLRPLDLVAVSVSDSDTGVYGYDIKLNFYWLH
ncbi:MAG: hypothetical protein WAV21_02125 [Minisyncoccia bacterium]